MDTASHSPPHLSESLIQAFLARLGERYEKPATLYLLGGSALLLLGSPRPTIDIDYLGVSTQPTLPQVRKRLVQHLKLDVEVHFCKKTASEPAGG